MTSIKSLDGKIALQAGKLNKSVPINQQPEVAAQQFEALLVQKMLESMWNTIPKNGLMGSNEEETYRGMLNEALANSISEGRGVGIKDVIMKDFSKLNKKV
jgi:Rod binding domain-containing protein